MFSVSGSVGRSAGGIGFVCRCSDTKKEIFVRAIQKFNSKQKCWRQKRISPPIQTIDRFFTVCELKRPSNNDGDRETIPQSVILLLRWGGGGFFDGRVRGIR